MGVISPDLISFRNSVGSKLNTMKTACDTLSSKLSAVSYACNTAKQGADSYYKSSNKELVLSSFDYLSDSYREINSSVDDTLSSLISESSSIIEDITELEEINKAIVEQQRIINHNQENKDAAISNRQKAQNEINRLNNEFDELHEKAKSKLSRLQSNSDSIELESLAALSTDSSSNDVVVKGGVFQENTYTAKNGKKVHYYIYIPEIDDSTEKLPINIYFHGVNDTVDHKHGLGELLRTSEIKPKGIVILPQADNGTTNLDFQNIYYQDAVIELASEVAKEYNGDMNKLSVAGHSNGGTAAYKIVNNHPGVFAACAPIAGVGNTDTGIMNTNLWVFQGAKDNNVAKNTGLRVVLKCEKKGCNARHYVYPDKGHDIQTLVFEDIFDDGNGNQVKLIDWLMSQELSA